MAQDLLGILEGLSEGLDAGGRSPQSREARRAPAAAVRDVRQAARAGVVGLASGLGLHLAAMAVGLAAFVVFTIGLTRGLALATSPVWGPLLVALAYGVVAFGIVAGARAVRRRARDEVDDRLMEAREEVRAVAAPLREAWAEQDKEFVYGSDAWKER